MARPMPMPDGNPVRLSAEVAGSLSRMQGLLQAAQPEIQSAYAAHWLAARQVGDNTAFQQMTNHALQGLYGTTALSGMLRWALSGRGTPEVMGGIIDQVNLIQQAYTGATNALNQVLQEPEKQGNPAVRFMTRSFTPLDGVYQQMVPPAQTVVQGLPWAGAAQVPGFPIQQANIQTQVE